jgi:hypothetical protein
MQGSGTAPWSTWAFSDIATNHRIGHMLCRLEPIIVRTSALRYYPGRFATVSASLCRIDPARSLDSLNAADRRTQIILDLANKDPKTSGTKPQI